MSSPYREPAARCDNVSWCCVCRLYTTGDTEVMKHPSGVGSHHVCCECITAAVAFLRYCTGIERWLWGRPKLALKFSCDSDLCLRWVKT